MHPNPSVLGIKIPLVWNPKQKSLPANLTSAGVLLQTTISLGNFLEATEIVDNYLDIFVNFS